MDNGWFISLETPCQLFNSAARYFRLGKTDYGEAIMTQHFRDLTEKIGADLQEQFPCRAKIIQKAFEAHRRKEFELSIPTMLAQADGIGEEIFGFDTSPSSTGKDAMIRRNQFIERSIEPSLKATFPVYCFAVASVLPINANKDKRLGLPSSLNRHLVLHGLSTDYPTETNALKTISWMQYIASFGSCNQISAA